MTRKLASVLLALAATACGQTQKVAAIALVLTPAVADPRTSPAKHIPPIVSAAVVFGDLKLDASNPQDFSKGSFNGSTGAKVSVTFTNADGLQTVALADLGGGKYGVLNSGETPVPQPQANPKIPEDPKLTFTPGSQYKFTITASDGQQYFGKVTPAEPTKIKELEASASGVTAVQGTEGPGQINQLDWHVNADFTVTRDPAPAAGTTPDLGFVAVSKVKLDDPTNPKNFTWVNLDKDSTKDLIDLVSGQDSKWRTTSVTVKGDKAFPEAGPYAVAISVVQKGAVSQNLFTGSACIAATGNGGILNVK